MKNAIEQHGMTILASIAGLLFSGVLLLQGLESIGNEAVEEYRDEFRRRNVEFGLPADTGINVLQPVPDTHIDARIAH